jgi:hypothetical protein
MSVMRLGLTLRPRKILIIDVDNNFVDNPEDLGIILNKIDEIKRIILK